jgi:SAM-dependent methyltransferase
MTPAQAFNEEQRARWNGIDGEHWAREQQYLERVLAPVTGPLLAFAEPRTGSTVLDVGCGCGATTFELARAVGPSGRVVGIDISEPMLSRAKERLRDFPHALCLLGDAAELPLQEYSAELIVSRLGVMFFGDPAAAFRNLRSGLRSGGRVRFACWRPIKENPWLQVPLHAIYEHVPRLPKPGPDEPGPFSFADVARVERLLMAAGFTRPSFTPLDLQLDLAAGGTLEDAARHSSGTGPARRALADQPEVVHAAAVESIRRALKPHETAGEVKLPAALWLVAAERSA